MKDKTKDDLQNRVEELESYMREIRKLCENNQFGVDPADVLAIVYVALGDKQWPANS